MSEKLLSISIAAYNAEKILNKAVESCIVKDKTILDKLEIIIVNDGSTDQTRQAAEALKQRFPFVHLIDKSNGGYGSTVNVAIKVAKGKYFKLLDSDDWYNTEELLKLMYELENTDSDMLVTNYSEVRPSGTKEVKYKNEIVYCYDVENLSQHFSMHAVAYKTELLRLNNIKLQENNLYTDTEFVAYPLLFIQSIAFFPYNIYQYSICGEGQSVSIKSRVKHIKDAEIVVNNLMKFVEKLSDGRKINYVYRNKMADISLFYINSLLLANDKGSKERLRFFDRNLKKNWYYVYRECFNKNIKLLRYTNYLGYKLCAFILKITLK